jgi:hypothetical protein
MSPTTIFCSKLALAGPPLAQAEFSDPLDPEQPRQRDDREHDFSRCLLDMFVYIATESPERAARFSEHAVQRVGHETMSRLVDRAYFAHLRKRK